MAKVLETSAPPDRVWDLIARPARWPEWSLYVRGAEGLGDPEGEAGARGKVILTGGVKVAAEIVAVEPGRSWSWKVGSIIVEHRVEPTPQGSRLSMPVRATRTAWSPLALAYAPVVDLFTGRIARLAERQPAGRET
mgnify:CR=1 FL=1